MFMQVGISLCKPSGGEQVRQSDHHDNHEGLADLRLSLPLLLIFHGFLGVVDRLEGVQGLVQEKGGVVDQHVHKLKEVCILTPGTAGALHHHYITTMWPSRWSYPLNLTMVAR